jgi:hypothetical protein
MTNKSKLSKLTTKSTSSPKIINSPKPNNSQQSLNTQVSNDSQLSTNLATNLASNNTETINDFSSCFNSLCKQLYLQRDRYHETDGRLMAGFEKSHNDQFQIIINKFTVQKITIDNFHDIMFKSFIIIDIKDFQPYAFKLLDDIINYNPLIFKDKFKEVEISTLTTIHSNLISQFNSTQVDKFITINQQPSLDDTTSQINNILDSNTNYSLQASNTDSHSSIEAIKNIDHSKESNEDFLIKKLEMLEQQNKLLMEQINKNNNNNTEQMIQHNQHYQSDSFKELNHNQIYYLCVKIQKLEHHLQIHDLHKKTNTTPGSLFYTNFPRPMFFDNDEYLSDYNKIIEKFQSDVMSLNIEEFHNRLRHTRSKLNEIKNIFIHLPDIDKYFENIQKDAENAQLVSFNNKYAAVTRYVSKPLTKDSHRYYKKTTNNNYQTNNSSLNTSNTSSYSTNTNRSHRNRVSFHNNQAPRSILRNSNNPYYTNNSINNHQRNSQSSIAPIHQQQSNTCSTTELVNQQPQQTQQQLFHLFNTFLQSNQNQLNQLAPQHHAQQNNNLNNNQTYSNENFRLATHITQIT